MYNVTARIFRVLIWIKEGAASRSPGGGEEHLVRGTRAPGVEAVTLTILWPRGLPGATGGSWGQGEAPQEENGMMGMMHLWLFVVQWVFWGLTPYIGQWKHPILLFKWIKENSWYFEIWYPTTCDGSNWFSITSVYSSLECARPDVSWSVNWDSLFVRSSLNHDFTMHKVFTC